MGSFCEDLVSFGATKASRNLTLIASWNLGSIEAHFGVKLVRLGADLGLIGRHLAATAHQIWLALRFNRYGFGDGNLKEGNV